jgi:hypothetical protein
MINIQWHVKDFFFPYHELLDCGEMIVEFSFHHNLTCALYNINKSSSTLKILLDPKWAWTKLHSKTSIIFGLFNSSKWGKLSPSPPRTIPFLRDFYASNIEKGLGFLVYLEVHIHVEPNILWHIPKMAFCNCKFVKI